jgi:hypothetical protein
MPPESAESPYTPPCLLLGIPRLAPLKHKLWDGRAPLRLAGE